MQKTNCNATTLPINRSEIPVPSFSNVSRELLFRVTRKKIIKTMLSVFRSRSKQFTLPWLDFCDNPIGSFSFSICGAQDFFRLSNKQTTVFCRPPSCPTRNPFPLYQQLPPPRRKPTSNQQRLKAKAGNSCRLPLEFVAFIPPTPPPCNESHQPTKEASENQ